MRSSLFSVEQPLRPPVKALSEADAIDVWIARWLRIRRKDLIARYGCDPRRLYEIWEGKKFPAARDLAMRQFLQTHPDLADRVDFGLHQSVPRAQETWDQLSLFEDQPASLQQNGNK
ncbi:MAG: hypothetical protein ACR2PG_04915 [Hyphomicrobiaceae bacterium]